MATDANASLISNRSTCSGVRSFHRKALMIALDGWDSGDGSGPATIPCTPIAARIGAQFLGLEARHDHHCGRSVVDVRRRSGRH
jgi:hypothetical protein